MPCCSFSKIFQELSESHLRFLVIFSSCTLLHHYLCAQWEEMSTKYAIYIYRFSNVNPYSEPSVNMYSLCYNYYTILCDLLSKRIML